MAQTVRVDSKTISQILKRLDALTEDIKAIKERLFEQEPLYGSDEWWEWSIRKSEEDYKKGNYVKFDSVEKAIKWLNS